MSISKNNVQYISLEGGGGAGNGYAGALKALHELNILKYDEYKQTNIKGFAGASAGALTSVLLACGYTPYELKIIMQMVNFEDFFDLGDIGEIPFKGGFTKKNLTQPPEPIVLKIIRLAIQGLANKTDVMVLVFSNPDIILQLYKELHQPEAVITFLALIIGFVKDKEELPDKVRQILRQNIELIAMSIYYDWGIFIGKTPRLFIQTLINYAKARVKIYQYSRTIKNLLIESKNAKVEYYDERILKAWKPFSFLTEEKMKELVIRTELGELKKLTDDLNNSFIKSLSANNITSDPKGTTFTDFAKIFECDLVIMGTNLETIKSHAFSASTTPDFYVEDAVRLSMSLPLFYKPFINKPQAALNSSVNPPPVSDFLNGIWIDGGYLNNSPLNIFESDKTIGLRLEQGGEQRTVINNLFKFLSVWPLQMGVFGVGESNISQTISDLKGYNSIILDTKLADAPDGKARGIGLFNFRPPDDIYDEVNKNTYDTVKNYFK